MNNMRQELAIMLVEKNGQELLNELVKYCEDQYNIGYEDAQIIMRAPVDIGCEFD